MKRTGWFEGKKVRGKCDVNYCHWMNIREFEFGNFCQKHFEKLPSCSNKECDNPAVHGAYNPEGLCRTCLFDYEPQLVFYGHSAVADDTYAGGAGRGADALKCALDKAIKKHKIGGHLFVEVSKGDTK
jgi:hypothetical protein